jgi:hypothetical protein
MNKQKYLFNKFNRIGAEIKAISGIIQNDFNRIYNDGMIKNSSIQRAIIDLKSLYKETASEYRELYIETLEFLEEIQEQLEDKEKNQ